jgi:hypothetical protein
MQMFESPSSFSADSIAPSSREQPIWSDHQHLLNPFSVSFFSSLSFAFLVSYVLQKVEK